MDLSNLTPGPRQARKRVGRGISAGKGKTAGKGHKGQKARSGYARRASFEGGQVPLFRRLPKRGFNHQDRHEMAEVNLDVLEAAFESGADLTTESLVESGVAKREKGGVKILGRGEITKALKLKVNAVSEPARAKIEAAGGSVEVIVIPKPKSITNRVKKPKQKVRPKKKGA